MHGFAAVLSPIHPYAIELKTTEYEQVEGAISPYLKARRRYQYRV